MWHDKRKSVWQPRGVECPALIGLWMINKTPGMPASISTLKWNTNANSNLIYNMNNNMWHQVCLQAKLAWLYSTFTLRGNFLASRSNCLGIAFDNILHRIIARSSNQTKPNSFLLSSSLKLLFRSGLTMETFGWSSSVDPSLAWHFSPGDLTHLYSKTININIYATNLNICCCWCLNELENMNNSYP